MREIDTGLIVAVRKGDIAEATVLLSQGADPGARDKDNFTAFSASVYSGSPRLVSLLFPHVSYSEKKKFGKLITAVALGNTAKAKNIISNDRKEIFRKDREGNTPAIFACMFGNDVILGMLMRKKCDIISSNIHGVTALIAASKKGAVKCAEMLLKKLSIDDLNRATRTGDTALMMAASGGHSRIPGMLLRRGARHEVKNRNGTDALFVAAVGGRLKSIKMLLEAGANPDTRGAWGKTPLMVAAQKGYNGIIKALLLKNASLNLRDAFFEFALFSAAVNGNAEGIRLLCRAGADTEMAMNDGKTALIAAAEQGFVECVAELLRGGARMEIKDNRGVTALLAASNERVREFISEIEACETDNNKGGVENEIIQ